jgi:hypothetical protein
MAVFTPLTLKLKRTTPFLSGIFLGVFSIIAVGTLLQFFLSPQRAKGASGATVSAPLLSRNLRLGDKGEDVRILQRFLNQNPLTQVSKTGPGSPLNESTYFGPLTKNAVIRFQELYASDVLAPAGLLAGTGFVGPFTRQKINIISGALTQTPSQSATSSATSSVLVDNSNNSAGPIITNLSQTSFSPGQTIKISGADFVAPLSLHIGDYSVPDPKINSSTEIEAVVPNQLGVLLVWIGNKNGDSRADSPMFIVVSDGSTDSSINISNIVQEIEKQNGFIQSKTLTTSS